MSNHYVYKTTNTTNDKIFIGCRTTVKDPTNDTYLGDNKKLIIDIKKYGKENFRKDVLRVCPSAEIAKALRDQKITPYNKFSNTCYNTDRNDKRTINYSLRVQKSTDGIRIKRKKELRKRNK